MTTLPILRPLLETPLAPYVASLHVGEIAGESSRPVGDLLTAGVMAETLRRFESPAWRSNRRAVFSYWSQYYFLRLLPPILAANMLFRHNLPVALTDVEVALDEKGHPVGFLLKDRGERLGGTADVMDCFFHLRERHLAPLIESWSEQASLSARVFWSNAGRCLDWTVAQLQEIAPPTPTWQPPKTWLETCHRETGLRRQACCLRDALAGVNMCPDCPKTAHA